MNNSAITQFHNSIIPKGDHDGLRPVAYEQDAGGYYPAAFKRKSAYPLDSKCLYESWYTGTNETGYSVCSCKPELELGADIGDFDFLSVVLDSDAGVYQSVEPHGFPAFCGEAVGFVRLSRCAVLSAGSHDAEENR